MTWQLFSVFDSCIFQLGNHCSHFQSFHSIFVFEIPLKITPLQSVPIYYNKTNMMMIMTVVWCHNANVLRKNELDVFCLFVNVNKFDVGCWYYYIY